MLDRTGVTECPEIAPDTASPADAKRSSGFLLWRFLVEIVFVDPFDLVMNPRPHTDSVLDH